MTTVVELYGDFWVEEDDEFAAVLKESLSPRGPEMLLDLFGETGVKPGELVLDIGGRDAVHSIELVRRFGVRVLMVDPIPQHLMQAVDRIDEEGLSGRIITDYGEIERLPLNDREVDHIWCRDVLNHVDVLRGLGECARVLPAGGGMMVYQTFATELLEFNEAMRLYRGLAINSESMSQDNFEAYARRCGFEIVTKDIVESEWRERSLESGDPRLLNDMLAISRMRRSREALERHYGQARYEAMMCGCLWSVYQLLGKLEPVAYLLRKL
jgi:ubiquinone/menaquinone biosynthesis C-methylase UbiE